MRAPGYYWYVPAAEAALVRSGVQIVRVETGYEVTGEQRNYVVVCGHAYGYREEDCPGWFVGPLAPPEPGEVADAPASR